MKTLILSAALALSTSVASAANAIYGPGATQIYGSNQGTSLNTFGTDGFRTTTGTVNGQNVNLNTFGSDTFRTTTGTIGGAQVNCNTFGAGSFRTTNCR